MRATVLEWEHKQVACYSAILTGVMRCSKHLIIPHHPQPIKEVMWLLKSLSQFHVDIALLFFIENDHMQYEMCIIIAHGNAIRHIAVVA